MTSKKDNERDKEFNNKNYQFPEGRRPTRHYNYVSRGGHEDSEEAVPQKDYGSMYAGVDTNNMTEDEKRAASRARVEQGRPEHEIKRAYWGNDKSPRADDQDLEANEKFEGGKSWKQIRAEEQKGGGKGDLSDKHKRFDDLLEQHGFDQTVPSAEATINALNDGLTGVSGRSKPGAPTMGRPGGNRRR